MDPGMRKKIHLKFEQIFDDEQKKKNGHDIQINSVQVFWKLKNENLA